MSALFRALTRRKHIDLSRVTETQLSRCLNSLDLTALGVGSTLGAGIYIVAGQVAKNIAGPSVMLSFLVAAVASIFAGLCYAEFGARVPKTGSAYVYSYLTVGEFLAFVIGWNLILEYVIGTASVARSWSLYFDTLVHNAIGDFLRTNFPMHVPSLAPYPDFFALGITLLLTVVLAIGVKESSRFNNIFTGLNMLVIAYCVICGLFKANFQNWSIPTSQVPNATYGEGGYFPYGVSGTLSGAATCFYAFVGFDAIATTGEEVKNPQKAIPISIILSLLFCFLAYFGVSAVLTLMVPYYDLDAYAPLPMAFAYVGWGVAKYVIAIGAVCGLSTSLLGAMFPMPRVIYAMASDGLIFRFLSHVSERFKTPFVATIVSGLMAGTGAMLFDVKELVDMMSIGTLLAYTLVAISVIVLRYKEEPFETTTESVESLYSDDEESDILFDMYQTELTSTDLSTNYQSLDNGCMGRSGKLREIFCPSSSVPTKFTGTVVNICTGLLALFMVFGALFLIFGLEAACRLEWWALLLPCLILICLILLLVIISRQPQNTSYITFKVPLLPFVPAASVFVNTYLMLKLSALTWIRFGVWMVLGLLIYFCYGIFASSEAKRSNMVYGSLNDDVATESEIEAEQPSKGVQKTERTSLIE